MSEGTVVSIHIAPVGAAPTRAVESVRAVAGMGLEGDRYFDRTGSYSAKMGPDREVTLIEIEAIEALARDYEVAIDAGECRRNIVTRGVALNHLVGKEFRVGEAVLLGMRLCEPCGHLAKLTRPEVSRGLVHRGGLRAKTVESGLVTIGDAVR